MLGVLAGLGETLEQCGRGITCLEVLNKGPECSSKAEELVHSIVRVKGHGLGEGDSQSGLVAWKSTG